MKKFSICLIFVMLLICFSACVMDNIGSLEPENEITKIEKVLSQKSYKMYNDGIMVDGATTVYDAQGRELEVKSSNGDVKYFTYSENMTYIDTLDVNGNEIDHQIVICDESGKVLRETDYDADGSLVSSANYIYENDCEILRSFFYAASSENDTYITKYNADGKILAETYISSQNCNESIWNYDGEDYTIYTYEDDMLVSETQHKFITDEKGRNIETRTYKSGADYVDEYVTIYDADGKKLEYYYDFSGDNGAYKEIYHYTNDLLDATIIYDGESMDSLVKNAEMSIYYAYTADGKIESISQGDGVEVYKYDNDVDIVSKQDFFGDELMAETIYTYVE